tara:strand:- start:328 stop:1290 length:963 start_codon:yes stop_codon:yes gene_type:complete
MNMIKSKNSYFEIKRAGINTTFQDLGRQNLNHIGIPVSGAMDKRNYILANALLKKDLNSPVIEFAYQGPLLKYKGEEIFIVLTGNVKFQIVRENKKKIIGEPYHVYLIQNNDQIDIQSTNRSVYGYISISEDFILDKTWGSYSINTKAKIGSNNGEKLSNNQKIDIDHKKKKLTITNLNYVNSKIQYIRVLKSINFDFFSEKSKNIFFNKEFKVTKLSDRMGMRLEGQVLENVVNSNIKSEGLVKGVIQVPSDGNPIIMLSDHGTIGGYPKIANVISADFDKLVQMIPGSVIKFKQVSLDEAEKLFKLYKLETDNLINQI